MSQNDQDLTIEQCEACRAGAPTLTEDELQELLPAIPEWEVTEVNGVPRLKRTFKFDGWLPALDFVTAVGHAAEENDHHPLIRLEWGKVTVSWWTHKIKGLHRNDAIMAAKTDALFGGK